MPSRNGFGPKGWVATLICLQLVLLIGVPALIQAAPSFDVVEELTWAPHWLIGTEKHPTLPSWLLETMRFIVPDPMVGPLILSEATVALTYVFIFRLGCLLLDPLRAAVGTLLLLGSYYFTAPTIEFNHNVLQMPIWAGLILQFALLRRTPASWPVWIGIGLTAGLGLWVKYSIVLLYMVLLLIGLAEAPIRRRLLSPQPYVMVLLAALVWAPHFRWLVDNDFLPMRYAQSRLAEEESVWGPLAFFLNQVLANAPIAVLLGFATWGTAATAERAPAIPRGDRTFLRVVTLAPLVLALLFLVMTGSAGKSMWGMPMFPTIGLLAAAELPIIWTMPRLRRVAILGMAVLVLVPICLFVSIRIPFDGNFLRTAWPMRELAAKADALWHQSEPGPLRFVGGDPWIAGLIVVGNSNRPVIINGDDISKSPWVNPTEAASAGVLYVTTKPDAIAPYCRDPRPAQVIPLGEPHIPTIYARVCHGS
jgi:4-amino-4-deoxy-L-arabinose transferase-like glycosyltransferase